MGVCVYAYAWNRDRYWFDKYLKIILNTYISIAKSLWNSKIPSFLSTMIWYNVIQYNTCMLVIVIAKPIYCWIGLLMIGLYMTWVMQIFEWFACQYTLKQYQPRGSWCIVSGPPKSHNRTNFLHRQSPVIRLKTMNSRCLNSL